MLAALLIANDATPAHADGAPRYTEWTGFYIGLNAGAIIDRSRYTLSPSGCFVSPPLCVNPANNPLRTDVGKFDDAAFAGGVQFGYNRHLGAFVLGVEGDINYSGLDNDDPVDRALAAPLVGSFIHNVSSKLNMFGTVRGRIGILPSPNWLFYGTGGFAFGHAESNSNALFLPFGDAYVGSSSSWRGGWTVGGGAEFRFASNWSAKVEYLRIDLGSVSYADPCVIAACAAFALPPSYQTALTLREDVVRFGLNYHLGSRSD